MIFQHTNRKKLMVIHILQIEFRLLFDTVHASDSKNILICAQVPRLHREIFMRVCVCTIPAFGSVCFPLSMHSMRFFVLSRRHWPILCSDAFIFRRRCTLWGFLPCQGGFSPYQGGFTTEGTQLHGICGSPVCLDQRKLWELRGIEVLAPSDCD